MPKSRKRKTRYQKKLTVLPPQTVKTIRPSLKVFFTQFSTIVLAIATLCGLVAFWPRLAVETIDDGANEMFPKFVVKNAGIISLHNVHLGMGICSLSWGSNENELANCNGAFDRISPITPWKIEWLSMDESMRFNPNDEFRGPRMRQADVTIKVYYEPWYFPVVTSSEFRFVYGLKNDPTVWQLVPLHR